MLAQIERHIREATRDITTLDVTTLIDVGAELFQLTTLIKETTNRVKGLVRGAVKASPPNKLVLNGKDRGLCTITFMPPQPQVRSGVDLKTLREVIGGQCFDRLFTTHIITTPRKGFQDSVLALDAPIRDLVMAAIDIQGYPPRVSFSLKEG